MNIVIPMAGHSRRFAEAGYSGPKALLQVDDKLMIEHVFDMFAADDSYYIVVNKQQCEEDPNLIEKLTSLAKNVSVKIIDAHENGPVYSALQINEINDDEQVIISYCDFTVHWDYSKFLRSIEFADGAIASFRGFHPASFGDTYYAYMRTEGNRMLELREKNSFTDNRMDEPASVGIYYFKSWALFKKYAKRYDEKDNNILPELYVSLIYNEMLDDGLDVQIYDVEHFICLGTPEDYEQYIFWYKYFSTTQDITIANKNNTPSINLVPMAGRGSRFVKFGYRTAKPLILVRGHPMVIRTVTSMPSADKTLYLARSEDLRKHPIEKTLNAYGESIFIGVDSTTTGQAATCLLAKEHLEHKGHLMIASCDYEHRYDVKAWEKILDDESIDGAVWTYRMEGGLVKNPSAFAYCETDENNFKITKIVEKQTISDSPHLDPLVIGTFWYRYADDFVVGASSMIDNGITVNGEHYVGTSINELISAGKKFVIFDVEQWISFGDPFELKILEYWEDYFDKVGMC